MAISYQPLFEDLGEFVQRITSFRALAADSGDFDTAYNQIMAELTSNSITRLQDEIPALFQGYRDTVTAWCDDMTAQMERRLLDRDTILEQLAVGSSTSIQEVFLELIRDMIANSKTIEETLVLIGGAATTAFTPATDVGTILSDGTVIANGILDGVTSPGSGMQACRDYLGVDTELAIAETMFITCVADADTNGLTEGEEEFEIIGQPPGQNVWDWRGEGSGDGPRIRTLQASGMIQNGEFESWSSSTVPETWTVTAGATSISRNVSAGAAKRGTYVFHILGAAGGTTDVTLDQAVTLTPGKRYACAFWIKADPTMTTSGSLKVSLYGTGYTEASAERVLLDNAALVAIGTTWTLKYFFVNVPFEIPSAMYLRINWDNPQEAKYVDIDGLGFGPAEWHNGICFAVTPGALPFRIGDRFSLAITKSASGVFQEVFRRRWGVQLPSAAVPSEPDTYATDA